MGVFGVGVYHGVGFGYGWGKFWELMVLFLLNVYILSWVGFMLYYMIWDLLLFLVMIKMAYKFAFMLLSLLMLKKSNKMPKIYKVIQNNKKSFACFY